MTEKETKNTTPEKTRLSPSEVFTQFLAELRDGVALMEWGDDIRELVEAVQKTGNPAELIIKFKFELADADEFGTIEVREETKLKRPRPSHGDTTFIITADAATATYSGVATPIKGAKLVVGADTWTIAEIESDGVLHECFCNRSVPNEISHPKYRHAAPVRGRR